MSSNYQPYPITEFKTGINTYLEPWMRPADAFEPLQNAYVYRGSIYKRAGSSVFGNQLDDTSPVMGIMQRVNQSTGAISLVAASTKNLYLYDAGANTFSKLLTVGGSNSIFWKGTATGTITMPSLWTLWSAGTVSVTDGTTTITANGAGNFTSGGIFAAGGTINHTTGSITLNFSGSTANTSLTISGTLAGNNFTGNITNFFNWTNWQPTDPTTFTSSVSYLYVTNGVDPVTTYDGTYLARPVLYVNSVFTDYITKALDVTVYKNRLLLVKPTLNSTNNALNQSIYFSALFSPFNFVNDVAGNGGQETAATGDIIVSEEPLRDAIVVNFTNSTWLFRFTGVDYKPFRFEKINNSKSNNAPYGSEAYDERTTSIGSKGLTACDGTNVARYDIPIIDYYETEIREQYYSQCFSHRYDNLNQTWMFYVSTENINSLIGGVAPGSDKALVYNFLENTWATFTFSTPMTCMGQFFQVAGTTWAQLTQAWEDTHKAWDSYTNQKSVPLLLAGDVNGYIYRMDDQNAVTDNGNSIIPDIVSTRWNPVIKSGQKVQVGYVDIYYYIASNNDDDPVQVTLNFFVDDNEAPALSKTLTLDGPSNGDFAWKRIYTNLSGQFVQMEIDPNVDSFMQFLGFIIWARPSGRLTSP
jgi:hypothetical protein